MLETGANYVARRGGFGKAGRNAYIVGENAGGPMSNSRRQLLRAALGFAAVPALVPAASALRVEDMDAPRQRLIVSACALIADLEGRGVAPTQARDVAMASDCPFCGCALGLAALGELPEAPPPPAR
jgi:hypothetical protein